MTPIVVRRMTRRPLPLLLASITAAGLVALGAARADEPPLIRDVPIPEFQSPGELTPYDFNAPPKGIFRTIQLANNFDEELGFRRSHEIVPVSPTEVFAPDSPVVYVVFTLFQHYNSFQVFGLCYPERVERLDPKAEVAKDTMYLTLEDESGYLKLSAPSGGWKPGTYKVEIYIGWEVNPIGLVGTMRFTVQDGHGHVGPPPAAGRQEAGP